MDLDTIIARLNERYQRASYGAVAGILGVAPTGLMAGRPLGHEDSWVVAATNDGRSGSRRGWPTGYTDDQIHPECLRQIREDPNDFIEIAAQLQEWLAV